MHPNEVIVRSLYEARAERNEIKIAEVLTDDVVWHEPGDLDYSGDYVGKQRVLDYLRKLLEVTEDTFQLTTTEFLCTDRYAAVLIDWSAQRKGTRSEGKEIAVYKLSNGRVSEVWFFPEVADEEALAEVFSLGDDA
jgi:ketosteroid isomerase-like protein